MNVRVIIPMAGIGVRFKQAGYTLPKPFINVHGKPMIARVLDNLAYSQATYTLVARREHASYIASLMQDYTLDITWAEHSTNGAVETVLLARSHIMDDEPLVIANSDQLVDASLNTMLDDMVTRSLDGLIVTFHEECADPKWSYAQVDARDIVIETKEKVPISTNATAGIYLFACGKDFIRAAEAMIAANDRTLGEFYICPVYNYLIRLGLAVGIFRLPKAAMHGLGTPEDLRNYLADCSTITR